jgi:hemerythrin
MPFMGWLPGFELGITEFDEHHKHLVYLLNMTYDGVTGGADDEELGAVLDELIDYATYHFAAEEHWMTVHNYPHLPEHSEEHERFCKRVVEVQKDFHNGKSNLGIEVMQFLNTWLTDHILITDREYARFALENL